MFACMFAWRVDMAKVYVECCLCVMSRASPETTQSKGVLPHPLDIPQTPPLQLEAGLAPLQLELRHQRLLALLAPNVCLCLTKYVDVLF